MTSISCFEWQNLLSDVLDGTLIGSRKKAVDEHIESCARCSERYKRYRLLLSALSGQPRESLPVSIRENPLDALLPSWDYARERTPEGAETPGFFSRIRTRWRRVPWHVRTSLEGASIVALVLIATSGGPRLRSFYESKVERSLVEFSQTFVNDSTTAPTAPLARGRTPETAASPGTLPAAAAAPLDEIASEGDESPDDPTASAGSGADDTEVAAHDGEIWRFILKTDSPHEVRARVIQILTSLKVPQDTPGLGGIEAPGGIQFDLMLSKSVIPPLKKQLAAIAPPVPEGMRDTPVGETFTWYKNRSRQPIPPGKTRIVIWLSQI